jgi:hypothetical protein
MTEPQPQHHRINWLKSAGNLALGVWGFLSYLALLAAVGWLATLAGPNPKAIALLAVLAATTVNWIVFAAIERRTRD